MRNEQGSGRDRVPTGARETVTVAGGGRRAPREGRPAVATTIDRWLDLARLAGECADGTWLFRGEAVSRDGDDAGQESLRPAAGRVGPQEGSARKLPHSTDHERLALDEFVRQARPHLAHEPASALEWLAIAQHHGMSTRLLDWTESLLVAAFFATREGDRAHGRIYGLKDLPAVSRGDERRPFDAKRVGTYRPPYVTARIPAQRSVLTLHPDPTRTFRPAGLCEWTIAPGACVEIRRVLDACGVNESSLFPDLDGLSRYIGWRYKWGKLSGMKRWRRSA